MSNFVDEQFIIIFDLFTFFISQVCVGNCCEIVRNWDLIYGVQTITALSGPQTCSNLDTTKPQDERKRENILSTGKECEYAEIVRDMDNVEDAG